MLRLGPALLLSDLVLAVHLGVIAFNLFGLAAIPLGGWLGWRFVRIRWWRLLHVASLAVVALQALTGRACFLTVWQDQLAGTGARTPLIVGLVNRIVYWPLPLWVFTAIYVLICAYTLALLWLVPPRRRFGQRGDTAPPPSR